MYLQYSIPKEKQKARSANLWKTLGLLNTTCDVVNRHEN
jgi:hypothetical protein